MQPIDALALLTFTASALFILLYLFALAIDNYALLYKRVKKDGK